LLITIKSLKEKSSVYNPLFIQSTAQNQIAQH
jgi:hypothetical protein